jgi:transcriptional regulator of acetoin/glycerol metabolism
LITGATSIGDELVKMLAPQVTAPVHTVIGWPRDNMPQQGTLIIRDVDRLTLDEQHAMLKWFIESTRNVQTIAVSAEPLFPLVARGEFLADLYYHLNHICVKIDAPDP